jgi:hypothetical protein
MVPGMDTESNGVSTAMWPEFCAGQVWQMEGSCIKISLVGKRLVHYKHFLGELKRAPVSLTAKATLLKHLQVKKAVLVAVE